MAKMSENVKIARKRNWAEDTVAFLEKEASAFTGNTHARLMKLAHKIALNEEPLNDEEKEELSLRLMASRDLPLAVEATREAKELLGIEPSPEVHIEHPSGLEEEEAEEEAEGEMVSVELHVEFHVSKDQFDSDDVSAAINAVSDEAARDFGDLDIEVETHVLTGEVEEEEEPSFIKEYAEIIALLGEHRDAIKIVVKEDEKWYRDMGNVIALMVRKEALSSPDKKLVDDALEDEAGAAKDSGDESKIDKVKMAISQWEKYKKNVK